MSSPTKRTLDYFRKLGFTADVVERRNPVMKFVTHDWNGFADIIATHPTAGIYAIQATSDSNHAARREKILAEPRAAAVAKSGMRIEVCSWGKRGKEKTWTVRREDLTEQLKGL